MYRIHSLLFKLTKMYKQYMKYVFVMFLAMKLKLIPGYNMYLWEYRIHALFYTKTIMFKQYITDDFSQIQLHSLNKYTNYKRVVFSCFLLQCLR